MEKNTIYHGSSLSVLKTFLDESIDLCVTSPPYWGLRNYGTDPEIWDEGENCEHNWSITSNYKGSKPHHGESSDFIKIQQNLNESQNYNWGSQFCQKCNAWKGELGLEPTPELYIKHLTDIFREVKRVLKSTGTLWVNIGDTYAGNCSRASDGGAGYGKPREAVINRIPENIKAKDLVGIPWMLAFSLRADGWYLRQDIIWAKAISGNERKGSAMPESVTDRCSKSHEYIFHFSKSPKYYFDNEAIKEPLSKSTKKRYETGWNGDEKRNYPGDFQNNFSKFMGSEKAKQMENGNRRSVWYVKLHPFKEAHFATFPENLIKPIILVGCPTKVCSKCGVPYQLLIEKENIDRDKLNCGSMNDKGVTRVTAGLKDLQKFGTRKIISKIEMPSCDCNDKSESGIVLDPFFGAGTTGVVAKKNNRDYIGIEKNSDYIKIAEKRLKGTFNPLF